MQRKQVKHLNTLAEYVYEAHSRIIQNCWELEGLQDVDVIFYADTVECRDTARYLASEITRKFSHHVALLENSLLRRIRSSTAAEGWLRRDYRNIGRCLFVTSLATRKSLERQAEAMDLNVKLFHAELFDINFFSNAWNSGRFDIFDRIRIRKAERLLVLDSDIDGWSAVFYLYGQIKKEYDTTPQIILVKDEEKALFNMEEMFIDYAHKDEVKERLYSTSVEHLLSAKEWMNAVFVLPQYKSWLADKVKTEMFFVYSCPLELGFRRNILQELCYKRILRMAEQYPNSLEARSFIQAYRPKTFSKARYALYRWIKRMELFVWHKI